MRPVRVRAQIIKIADCVRIAVFFSPLVDVIPSILHASHAEKILRV